MAKISLLLLLASLPLAITPMAPPSKPGTIGGEQRAKVGAEGGTLTSSDGELLVTVSVGALNKEGTLSAKRQLDGESGQLASGAFDLTILDTQGNALSSFSNDVEICLRPHANSNVASACLGYFDEKSKGWTCEDPCVKKNDKGMLCGTSSHFTNFALLLTGGSGPSDKCGDSIVYATGGKVVSSDKLTSASFPSGAVLAPTHVTVQTVATKDPAFGSSIYSFTPSMTFKQPVQVCVTPNQGAKTSSACLGYLDESVKPARWVCEDKCLDGSGKQLCGTTTHFTNFALLLAGGSGKAGEGCK